MASDEHPDMTPSETDPFATEPECPEDYGLDDEDLFYDGVDEFWPPATSLSCEQTLDLAKKYSIETQTGCPSQISMLSRLSQLDTTDATTSQDVEEGLLSLRASQAQSQSSVDTTLSQTRDGEMLSGTSDIIKREVSFHSYRIQARATVVCGTPVRDPSPKKRAHAMVKSDDTQTLLPLLEELGTINEVIGLSDGANGAHTVSSRAPEQSNSTVEEIDQILQMDEPASLQTARGKRKASADPGILSTLKFRVREGLGVTKKVKRQQSTAIGRTATINQASNCPAFLDDFNQALLHTRDVSCMPDIIGQFPVLFDEECLKNRDASAKRQNILRRHYRFNFAVPSYLVRNMKCAVVLQKEADGAIGERIDLSSPVGQVQYVVKIVPSVRGFSE